MRRDFALAAAAALAAAGAFASGDSGATGRGPSALECKLAGMRYAGAAAGKAKVCFTLTANGKAMREFALDIQPCPKADVILFQRRFAYRRTIRANGRFSVTAYTAATSGGNLGQVSLTFSGRIRGSRASGSLELHAQPSGSSIACSWTARRAAR